MSNTIEQIKTKIKETKTPILRVNLFNEQRRDQEINRFLGVARRIMPEFKIDDDNRRIIFRLLDYFTGHPDFSGSLKKGILLVGGIGTGKSKLFEIFHEYLKWRIPYHNFNYFMASEIVDDYALYGVDMFEKFRHNWKDEKKTIASPITCYIDDIATDNENERNFGKQTDVIAKVLDLRYTALIRYGVLTHASTNVRIDDMNALYDLRLVDRMREMFNVLTLTGNSRRK
jgi:DNA replication protein DnaC